MAMAMNKVHNDSFSVKKSKVNVGCMLLVSKRG